MPRTTAHIVSRACSIARPLEGYELYHVATLKHRPALLALLCSTVNGPWDSLNTAWDPLTPLSRKAILGQVEERVGKIELEGK